MAKLRLRNTAFIFASIPALIILGCGGGGGGGSGGSSSAPSTPVTISAANASTAAGTASDAATNGSAAPLGPTLIGGASTEGSTERLSLVKLSEWVATESTKLTIPPSFVAGASYSGTINCSVSGSYSYNYNDADNNSNYSAGDRLSMTFNSCRGPSSSSALNGSLSFSITSLTGSPGSGAWSAGMSMTFTNLTTSVGAINGDLSASFSTSDGTNINATLSGSSLNIQLPSGVTHTTSSYSFTVSYNKATDNYTMDATGTSSSTVLGGSVTFSTPTPFSGNFSNSPDNPSSGILIATGSSNSKLRLTALSNTNVQLEVDADGDGTYETSNNTTWVAIQGYR